MLFRAASLPVVGQFLRGLGRQGWSDPGLSWCLAAMLAATSVAGGGLSRSPAAGCTGLCAGYAVRRLGRLLWLSVFAGALALKVSLDATRIAAGGSRRAAARLHLFPVLNDDPPLHFG